MLYVDLILYALEFLCAGIWIGIGYAYIKKGG